MIRYDCYVRRNARAKQTIFTYNSSSKFSEFFHPFKRVIKKKIHDIFDI